MKITVERDAFAEAIGAAVRASGRASTIPILGNVLITPNGSALEITGTNLDLQMQAKVAAEIEGPSTPLTVRGDALAGIVGQMPKGAQLILEADAAKLETTIRSGRARYKLLTLPVDQFPAAMEVKAPVSFTLPGKEFAGALGAVKFAISKDRSRPVWHGIHMSLSTDQHVVFGAGKGPRLVFCALDGYELARVSMAQPAGADEMPPVILPDIAIPEIIRLAADSSEVCLNVSPALVMMTAGRTDFTTKLIDGTWPNYVNGVPGDNEKQMIVDCDALAAAINRLRTIDDGSAHGSPLHVAIADSTLTLTLSNSMMGDATEQIEIEWNAESYEISLRSKGLLNIIEAMNADVCVLSFGRGPLNGKEGNRSVIVQPWRDGRACGDRSYFTMPLAF